MASFYPNLYQRILALLVAARNEARISERELAEQFKQPEAFVASYESGERMLDVGEFVAIARALSVDPYELLKQAQREPRRFSRSELCRIRARRADLVDGLERDGSNRLMLAC